MRKDKNGNTKADTAAQESIKTYGSSVNILTGEIFGNDDSIGQRAYQEMQSIMNSDLNKSEAIAKINSRFGDSIDKLIVIRQLKENKNAISI